MPNPPVKPKPKPKPVIHPNSIQARYALPNPNFTAASTPWDTPGSPFHPSTTDAWKAPNLFHPESTDAWKPSDTNPASASASLGPSAADLKKWNDTVAWNAAVAANAALNKSTGGSSGGASHASFADAGPVAPAFTPAVADLSKNPYPGYYDKLLAYVQANADSRPAEYAAVGDQFKANQAAADQGMYNSYQGSRAGTDASAAALGVDPAIVSQARDLAMRKSQENSDQSLADNQAWLAKMGILSQQQGQAYVNQYQGEKATASAGWDAAEQQRVADANLQALQALVAQQKAASSGGGGGKKKGGGGGSSGKSNLTQTDTVQFSGADQAIIDELNASGQHDAAAWYAANHNLTMGNAEVKSTQQHINDATAAQMVNGKKVAAPSIYLKDPNAKYNSPAYIAAQQASSMLPIYQAVLPKVLSTSGLYNNPYSKTSMTTKGKG